MNYSNIMKVNENFQYSVNLQFDINNISKIKEYIPTKDGCEVLKNYFYSVINGKNRASILIGPYGKGKSHLLLVFMTLINNYEEEDRHEIEQLMEKVKKIDEELYYMIRDVRKNKTKLMPIIINSNYDDIHQAFLLGIAEALEREKLADIALNTYFDIALDVIKIWETEYKEVLNDLKKCLENNNTTLKDLKQGLKAYAKEYYELFKEVYRCISRGQEFKPLINTDIVKIYKDICHEICQIGYSGVYIAFDEFSKFLESSNERTIMRDMKILQDFAELAARTGKSEQIHLSCITHKGMNEYLKLFDENKSNSLKTVEGRFKNIYFNSSIEQNYEIVSHAIKKQAGFHEYFDEYRKLNKDIYDRLFHIDLFKHTDNIEKILFRGCFPLNPITTYALIELSEKIAQNERTLFTFLTDDDTNGLKYFIMHESNGLFTIDKIYDYFYPLFKKETDEFIKSIYMKTENALRKNISAFAKKILKAVSIMYMINHLDELSPTDQLLQLGLGMSHTEYHKSIEELFEKSILRRKKITEELDFATSFNRKLTKDIKELMENKYMTIHEKNVLNEVIGVWYSIPRRYNENYKITRFFCNIFMTEEELLNITNFDILFEQNDCDGIIINLIRNSKNITEVKEHFHQINDDRVVLKISQLIFSKTFSNLLKEYEAIKYLRQQNLETIDLKEELDMMKEEIIDAIQDAIKEYLSDDNILSCLYLSTEDKKVKYLSAILSKICDVVYDKTPIINNELINKRELSAPIKKARSIVIDCVLNNAYTIKSSTSAEATIYKAIVGKADTESVKNIVCLIKDFIHESDNHKKSFQSLYTILETRPYSIRKGIIPILLSMALRDYSDNIIIYYLNREIDLNADTLIRLNDNPEKYYIVTEKGTAEKMEYINCLMEIFGLEENNTLRKKVHNLVEEMKKWILGMPRLIKETSPDSKELELKTEYLRFKSELLRPDINNNELLFNTLPNLFPGDFQIVVQEIRTMKQTFDAFLSNYQMEVIQRSKAILNPSYKGSFVTLLKELSDEIGNGLHHQILDLKTKAFVEYISNIQTHDENKVINKIVKIVTGFYIEDWQPSEMENYENALKQLKEKLQKKDDMTSSHQKIILINGDKTVEKNLAIHSEISALGVTMMNNIEEILEEYGGALDEQEKINVLLEIMKKYM